MNLVKVSFCLAVTLAAITVSNATILDFNDVNNGTKYIEIPDGFKGFNWGNLYAVFADFSQGSGDESEVISGYYAVFNGSGSASTLQDGLFDFTGAYFTPAWHNSFTSLEMKIDGYKNGNLEYSTILTLDSLAPAWITFEYLDIDTLSFNTIGYKSNGSSYSISDSTQFVMDDFTFTVPEPATMLLVGIGASWIARRRRH